jgi:hypothetical protein
VTKNKWRKLEKAPRLRRLCGGIHVLVAKSVGCLLVKNGYICTNLHDGAIRRQTSPGLSPWEDAAGEHGAFHGPVRHYPAFAEPAFHQ